MNKVLDRIVQQTDDAFKERSCRNCAHRTGIGGAWDWNCARYGGFMLSIAIQEQYCGPNLRGWSQRRSWWQRFSNSGDSEHEQK